MGATLRYPYEGRDEGDYFDDIENEKIPKGRACSGPVLLFGLL
jgi:hypothetical protein